MNKTSGQLLNEAIHTRIYLDALLRQPAFDWLEFADDSDVILMCQFDAADFTQFAWVKAGMMLSAQEVVEAALHTFRQARDFLEQLPSLTKA